MLKLAKLWPNIVIFGDRTRLAGDTPPGRCAQRHAAPKTQVGTWHTQRCHFGISRIPHSGIQCYTALDLTKSQLLMENVTG